MEEVIFELQLGRNGHFRLREERKLRPREHQVKGIHKKGKNHTRVPVTTVLGTIFHTKNTERWVFSCCCCCSVAKLGLTLCRPGTAARQASLSFTISQSLLKLMSTESVMPSNHLILCCPFSSCPQSFPASRSFPMSQLLMAKVLELQLQHQSF